MRLQEIPNLDVYVNPQVDDLNTLKKALPDSMVRFILVQKTKGLYCFPASVSHDQAMIALGLYPTDVVITGIGQIEQGRIRVADLPNLDVGLHFHPESVRVLLGLDWSWAEFRLEGFSELLAWYRKTHGSS